MATKLMPLILLFIAYSFLQGALSITPPDELINKWCDQTPFPDQCKHFIKDNPKLFVPNQKSDFRKLIIEIALEHAKHVEEYIKGLGSKCRNKNETAAWADCLKLYENTIHQLNKTIDPHTNCTEDDTQTWLSTALTNLETCRAGFVELGVMDYILPLISNNNISQLICNTLALKNGNMSSYKPKYKGGFPTWVPPGDRRRLLQATPGSPNAVVAQDGSGNYRTIKAALDAAAARSGDGRYVIHIKSGVYQENLEIGSSLKNIMLVGDGMRYTIITGSRSVGGGSTTFNSGTVIVTGEGFIAQGITFRNTAGPENHQAVALRSSADLSVFYRCGFEGYQDTLYVHSQRQFYKECYIYGTIDFIFGNSAVVIQNCMIYARRPLAQQKNVVTAQGRTDPNQNTGIVIHNSRIMASADLVPVLTTFKSFLGRPWKLYSRTIVMQSFLDSLIDPAGWLEWDGNFALDTLDYGEFNNFGPGSPTTGRVKWEGYRVITRAADVSQFTVANFIAGQSWLPATNVPFTAGL